MKPFSLVRRPSDELVHDIADLLSLVAVPATASPAYATTLDAAIAAAIEEATAKAPFLVVAPELTIRALIDNQLAFKHGDVCTPRYTFEVRQSRVSLFNIAQALLGDTLNSLESKLGDMLFYTMPRAYAHYRDGVFCNWVYASVKFCNTPKGPAGYKESAPCGNT